MKVCILTTSYPAFIEDIQSPFVFRFTKGLIQNNVDVDVVCPYSKKSKFKNENYSGINIYRFTYFIRKFRNFTEIGSIPDAMKTIYGKLQMPFFCIAFLMKSLIISKKSDIIHAQWIIPSGFIGVILKKIYNKPLVVTTRGAELILSSKNKFWRLFLQYTINNADFIASNNVEHIKILKSLGVSDKKIKFIPNGLDYDLYKPRSKKIIRKKLNLNLNDKIILYVGYLIERKRVDILINSFKELLKFHPNLKLIIVGDGPLKQNLISLTLNLNLQSNVIFLGKLRSEEVALYMNAADVFSLTSSSEGRPNVVLEALASGLPVITTPVGDVTSFLINNVNAFIVDPPNFVDKLHKILSSKVLRNKFSKNGLNAVKKANPSWEESAKPYINLYIDLKWFSHIS